MKKLMISSELSVPVDIVTEALAWIGARGSGKTHGTGKLVELLIGAGAPVVVLDPVGVWYGLRLAKDGKGAGLAIPVFGGLHGDVPLEPTAGAVIADLICDKNISAILDVSQFETDSKRARFTADFAERLFTRKKKAPSVLHWVIDEAQEFIPQNPQPGEQMMLHHIQRILKIGRNFGIGASIISPRPQEINKKVLNGCQTVLAFRLTGAHERKAMRDWIAAHDVDDEVVKSLPSLETGNCHIWSPAFLKVSKEIRILPKETFDASATPKFGAKRVVRELTPIDLAALREAMAATVEKAKAEDPKELRLEIAKLKTLLADAQRVAALKKPEVYTKEKVVEKIVEVTVLPAAILKRVEKYQEQGFGFMAKLNDIAAKIGVEHQAILVELRKVTTAKPPLPKIVAQPKAIKEPERYNPAPRYNPALPPSEPSGLKPAIQRILDSIAFIESLGVQQADKRQVALFAGQSPTSGNYTNYLGGLRTQGLITYPSPGMVALTDAGRAAANNGNVPQTNAELHAHLLGRLSPAKQRVLKPLLDAYPNPMNREDLGNAAGQSPTSGNFTNYLGELRTLRIKKLGHGCTSWEGPMRVPRHYFEVIS